MGTRVLRSVRRGVLMLTLTLATTGLTLTTVAPAPGGAAGKTTVQAPDATPRVTATELLPPPGSAPGTRTAAFDLNNEGQVVGASYEESLDILGVRPVLWDDGRATQLPAPDESETYRAEQINDRGDVLVQTVFAGAYRWFDGQVTDLRATEDEWVTIHDLNESGQAIITRSPRSGVHAADTYGLWEDGTFTRLLPEGEGAAHSIGSIDLSDAGHVAGTLTPNYPLPIPVPVRAFSWHDGTFRVISEDYGSRALAVNRHGQVVGQITGGDWTLWDADGQATRLPIEPTDINDRGQVLGAYRIGDGPRMAAIWDDGRVTTVGTLGGSWTDPMAINERGQVVGMSETPDGKDHWFFWTGGHMLDLGLTGPALNDRPPLKLNDEGQAIGEIETPEGLRQMLWTVDDGSGDPGEGGCVSATNAVHVQVGRATSALGLAWAVGSGQFLGLTSRTTALRQTAPAHWERVASC
jgi:probable HAF family extracellular repeat protein